MSDKPDTLYRRSLDAKPLPSVEYLHQRLSLDARTGELFWKDQPDKPRWSGRYAGKRAFTTNENNGYICGWIDAVKYMAHRIIFKMAHGFDPMEIDHINGVRTDNRPSNLREVTRSMNSRNRKRRSDNSSGHTGVRQRSSGRWEARIHHNGREQRLGLFDTMESAIAAHESAKQDLGYEGRHGR